MAITKISQLPTPPSTSDATNFYTRADSFLAALPKFADECNAFADTATAEIKATTKEAVAEITNDDAALNAIKSDYLERFDSININKTKGTLMTIELDETSDDPRACLSASHDAKGVGKEEMLAWLGLKPVLFKDEANITGLELNDYSKYKGNGLSADIATLGNDVMVALPQKAWRIRKENRRAFFDITDDLTNERFIRSAW